MYIRIGIFKKLIREVMIGEKFILVNDSFEISRTGFKNGLQDIEEIQLNGEYYTVKDYNKIKEILERM